MTARRIALLGALVVALAAAVWIYLGAGSAGNTPGYRTQPVERGPLTAAVSATGSLNAVVTVQVGSQVSGQVKELYADFNTSVKRGQLIALIDPASFEARVSQAAADVDSAAAGVLNQTAALERARADVDNMRASIATARANTLKAEVALADAGRDRDRKRDLRQRELIAQAEMDAAQTLYDSAVAQREAARAQERAAESNERSALAAVRVAEAQLAAARAALQQKRAALSQARVDLGHTRILAPVDGVVVSRNVDVGQTVAASLQAPVLFTIAQDLSRMQVDTSVDEADVGRVRVGQEATFTVDAFPTRTFTGAVRQIRKAPQVVQNVVTYTVVVGVANAEQTLLPGMTANVRIVTDSRTGVLRVPNAALRFRPPGTEREAGTSAGGGRSPGMAARRADGRSRPAGAGVTGRVWVLGPDARPQPVDLVLGITDGVATEVIAGDLREGTQVLVGLRVSPTPPAAGGGMPRLRI
jgi:HlyD family secretion protein